MVLLHSAGPNGICYVETKNLDGETNLKHKNVPKELNEYYSEESRLSYSTRGTISCQTPNNQIYTFDGSMEVPDEVIRHFN